jgi:hypothetical protein
MSHILANNQDALRTLAPSPKQSVPDDQIWHVWTVTIPRRSITGRLVWGTVWRRRDDGQWIYKKYTEWN